MSGHQIFEDALDNFKSRLQTAFKQKHQRPPLWLAYFWVIVIRVLIIIIVISISYLPVPQSRKDLPFHDDLKSLQSEVKEFHEAKDD